MILQTWFSAEFSEPPRTGRETIAAAHDQRASYRVLGVDGCARLSENRRQKCVKISGSLAAADRRSSFFCFVLFLYPRCPLLLERSAVWRQWSNQTSWMNSRIIHAPEVWRFDTAMNTNREDHSAGAWCEADRWFVYKSKIVPLPNGKVNANSALPDRLVFVARYSVHSALQPDSARRRSYLSKVLPRS